MTKNKVSENTNNEKISGDLPDKVTKRKLTHSFVLKTTAFISLVILVLVQIICGAGIITMLNLDFYTKSLKVVNQDTFEQMAYTDAQNICNLYEDGNKEDIERYCEGSNFKITISSDGKTEDFGEIKGKDVLEFSYDFPENRLDSSVDNADDELQKTYKAEVLIDRSYPVNDKYSFWGNFINIAYETRYLVFAISGITLIASIIIFIFLICSSGCKEGVDGLYERKLTKIPFDLYSAIYVCIVILWSQIVFRSSYSGEGIFLIILFTIPTVISLSIAYCMNFSVRAKSGNLLKNTIIFRFLKFIFSMLRNIPRVWKTVLSFLIASIVISILAASEHGFGIFLWFILEGVLLAVCIYIANTLQKLEKAAKSLASGDLTYHIDTGNMIGGFKSCAENLNSVATGMNRAVEERMKSERFKTELITNVSHDIKTPLTSIINYTDLISKEKTDNKKITEYTDVLSRQSDRLKKLIEDLLDASKANSGSINVNLAPCDVGVMLTQVAGEYDRKLKDNNLKLITKNPDKPVIIMADGKLLWRVFDNLINNICKYSQPDTRAYLNLETAGNKAIITFKNMSKEELDISEEELTERFVRGDSSRNSDGNGLGLSIAKGFTELQGGTLKIMTDGDLFKVTLQFDNLK